MINTTTERQQETALSICQYFIFYELFKFRAMLS